METNVIFSMQKTGMCHLIMFLFYPFKDRKLTGWPMAMTERRRMSRMAV
jgi:hypothetical protein